MIELTTLLKRLPLIAVLRGIPVQDAETIGSILIDTGFLCLEIPFNSPDPLKSIATLVKKFSNRALIGAGTILNVQDVKKVADVGGRLIITPHTNVEIIQEAKRLQLLCIPGFSTPTEAFTAIAAGADALKLFPAEANPPAVLKSLMAVLPPGHPIFPVGSITPEKMLDYYHAGAAGFCLGGALYRPNDSAEKVLKAAQQFVAVAKTLFKIN
ncbi:MAG: 2-dehydro-3-deoxy-6-phosphogalactonate aldolase [Coxiella sp. RIFCSPHIGHO2_12_FULL_42_15]|nr:MAG: 2-dehydro-3-deoxy-6-phosphogalactonate aldolase [Coxiella sp. RIFCSPHIGHO2_12_FULL_42_15]